MTREVATLSVEHGIGRLLSVTDLDLALRITLYRWGAMSVCRLGLNLHNADGGRRVPAVAGLSGAMMADGAIRAELTVPLQRTHHVVATIDAISLLK